MAAVNPEMSLRADQLADAVSHARDEAAAAQAQRDRSIDPGAAERGGAESQAQ